MITRILGRFKAGSMVANVALYLAISSHTCIGCRGGTRDDASAPKAAGESFRITGRLSMGPRDGFQCYQSGSYTADEKVNGRWIVGVDGANLGTLYDAHQSPGNPGSQCGRILTITSNGRCENFVIVDRIWENDGAGNGTYGNKSDADRKTKPNGPGYPQLDIAKAPFYTLFGGSNPTSGYQINWNATCPNTIQSSAGLPDMVGTNRTANAWNRPPGRRLGSLGQSSNVDYLQCAYGVSCSNGWGWHPAGQNRCLPGSAGWKPDANGCSCRCGS